jgi:uncharacterized protein
MRIIILVVVFLAVPSFAQERPLPILDMHLHAGPVSAQGPPPVAICAPFEHWPDYDPRDPAEQYAMKFIKEPPCAKPLWSPESDEALMKETLAVLERRNIFAVTSGSPEDVRTWKAAAPERIIPALQFWVHEGAPGIAAVRELFASGEFAVFGEVTNQYFGIAPDDPRFAPYVALLEELDIPLGIHVGPGPPGTHLLHPMLREHRVSTQSPLLLEGILRKHPRLRVYAMHAGWPMIDEMITMLFNYPSLYVDIGILAFAHPRAESHRYLERLVRAGFGRRILFGSDQMVWPEAIERALSMVEEAPFLSPAQKRDILYNNAARFLRLSQEEIARHHGRN